MKSYMVFKPGLQGAFAQFSSWLQGCPSYFDKQIKRDFALNNPLMMQIMMKSLARQATIQVTKEDWGIAQVDLFETASVAQTNLHSAYDPSSWKLIETVYQAEKGRFGKVKEVK